MKADVIGYLGSSHLAEALPPVALFVYSSDASPGFQGSASIAYQNQF